MRPSRVDTPAEFARRTLGLLDLEREAEVAEARKLLEQLPEEIQQARGVALFRLEVTEEGSGYGGRTVWSLGPRRGTQLPAHRIRSGDVVTLRGGDEKAAPLGGVVTRVRTEWIQVALDADPDAPLPFPISVQRVANEVTWRRLGRAMRALATFERGPCARVIDLAFGLREPSTPDEERFEALDATLDASQRTAVAFALATPDLALIHGPPGTGKTTAVCELIRQEVGRRHRVLACAPTNVAVDNLAERLADAGLRIVRMGHPARVHPHLLGHSLDAQVRKAVQSYGGEQLAQDLDRELKRRERATRRDERELHHEAAQALRDELKELERDATRRVLGSAEVVLATTTGAGDGMLRDVDFDLAVVDEAAQALEAAAWIPLLKARRAVLVGDHRQLPPTLRSAEAARLGLERTLFDRLMDVQGGALGRMLTVQYRMHETIMAFSSEELYEGRLEAHPTVAAHRLIDLEGVRASRDSEAVLVLIDTAGCDLEEVVDRFDESKSNPGEVGLVRQHLDRLFEAGVRPTDVAVIAPYLAQVHLLRTEIGKQHPGLEIDTVDGFQGREKEAILISLTRSNPRCEVGFLADERRLNVALTRARRHLCVIGDSATIGAHPFLSRLVDAISDRGEYRSAYEYL